MSSSTVKISKSELIELIDHAVEQKLLELLGDPDAGLTIKKSLHSRLLRQKRSIAKGQRGQDFDQVVNRLGLQ